jgi:uncharacterized protein YraI
MQAGSYSTLTALWLRKGPGTNFEQLALMPQNATFVADGNEQNGFASGHFGQVAGWASVQYLGPLGQGVPQAQATPEAIQLASQLVITGEGVALRSAPEISSPAFGVGSNVVTMTTRGAIVQNQDDQKNGFEHITYNGQDGWLSLNYLAPKGTPLAPIQGVPQVPVKGVTPEPPKVQTEIGAVGGGVAAVALIGVAIAIYFLAK